MKNIFCFNLSTEKFYLGRLIGRVAIAYNIPNRILDFWSLNILDMKGGGT